MHWPRARLAQARLLGAAGWTVTVVFTSKSADEAVGGWHAAFDRLCEDRSLPQADARWLWAGTPSERLGTARGGAARLAGWIHTRAATGGRAPVVFVDSPTVLPLAGRAKHLYNGTRGSGLKGRTRVLVNRARWGVPQFGARIVMTMHLNHLSYEADPVTGPLTRRFADRIEDSWADVDRLVVITHRQAEDLTARYPDLAGRILVIGQPALRIDRSVLPARSGAPLCAVVTRLDPNKRLDALIALWPKVVGAVPEACLEIWGSGPDEARLAELAQASPASGSIRMAGFTGAPLDQLARAWCTVSTSEREATPLAVMVSLAGSPSTCAAGPRRSSATASTGSWSPTGTGPRWHAPWPACWPHAPR